MLYKAFVRDKETGKTTFMEYDYDSKSDFISDLKHNGYTVIRVEPKELYDFVLENTNGDKYDWEAAKKLYKEGRLTREDHTNMRMYGQSRKAIKSGNIYDYNNCSFCGEKASGRVEDFLKQYGFKDIEYSCDVLDVDPNDVVCEECFKRWLPELNSKTYSEYNDLGVDTRTGEMFGQSRKAIKSSLSDVNKAFGFTDNDIEEDGRIHITTDFGEFVVDYVNDEYIVTYDGEERTFTDYKDTVEEVVDLFNQLGNEEIELFNKNIKSSKQIKSALWDHNKAAVDEIMKYCDDLHLPCGVAGNTFTVAKDFIQGPYKNIDFESVEQVKKEIDNFVKSSRKPIKSNVDYDMSYKKEFDDMVEENGYDVNDEFTYMIGIGPENWSQEDTDTARAYSVTVHGYYKLGPDNEGMVVSGTLQNIYDFCDDYWGMGLHLDYVCPKDSFDWEDGEWVTGQWLDQSKKLIKSSDETLEYAYDSARYCANGLRENGTVYNKWYITKAQYGQDNAWIVAEHTDYSVRLYFTFMETGFIYVDGTYTNGASYDKKTITSWRFEEEPSNVTLDRIKEVLDNFFNDGINRMREE